MNKNYLRLLHLRGGSKCTLPPSRKMMMIKRPLWSRSIWTSSRFTSTEGWHTQPPPTSGAPAKRKTCTTRHTTHCNIPPTNSHRKVLQRTKEKNRIQPNAPGDGVDR